MTLPSQSLLRELFSYDENTGHFTRLVTVRNGAEAGTIAGSHDSKGYIRIGIDRRQLKAHRLAWVYVYGVEPDGHIDHINGICDDNRIANLRICTPSLNAQNRVNLKGAYKHKYGWQSCIKLNGEAFYLGSFKTEAEARAAYREAKARLHDTPRECQQ